jgi:protein tyrosine phosphatase (PTP) superfamily phosphohydrolase (DUF442 family)
MVLAVLAGSVSLLAQATSVTKPPIDGVRNFARLETTVACGGPVTGEGAKALKEMGFKSIFDLQLASEATADIPGETAAAKAAGMNFIHVPFTPSSPDLIQVDTFLREVVKPGNDPAYIHCGGGNRAAGFWFIKRVLVDKWAVDRALEEAETLGLSKATDAPMRAFVLDYVKKHSS